jgi:catechol 2,3-dioxygenase-like lactoylglutathione lyase family enzyme
LSGQIAECSAAIGGTDEFAGPPRSEPVFPTLEALVHGAPVIGSVLLASTDPARLRAWYERAFGATADADGFLRFGDVGLLIDARDDVAARTAEPARVIINLHVSDAQAIARHLTALEVTWVAALEYREAAGAWFGTVLDPDGNYVQVIELTEAYWAARRERHGAGTASAALGAGGVATRLPAQDLERARRFYAEKLGLEPVETRPGGLRYECASGGFALFQSTGRPSGEHTQMGWKVADLEAAVTELRDRGVKFEHVDVPGLRTINGIADVEGNYPSTGATGERAAWFRDSEGNLLGIGQPTP